MRHLSPQEHSSSLCLLTAFACGSQNLDYQRYIQQSGYLPRITQSWLQHWHNGRLPPGHERKPVTHVSRAGELVCCIRCADSGNSHYTKDPFLIRSLRMSRFGVFEEWLHCFRVQMLPLTAASTESGCRIPGSGSVQHRAMTGEVSLGEMRMVRPSRTRLSCHSFSFR